jgi:hypothetical protein
MATRAMRNRSICPIDFGEDFHGDLLVGQRWYDAHELPLIEIARGKQVVHQAQHREHLTGELDDPVRPLPEPVGPFEGRFLDAYRGDAVPPGLLGCRCARCRLELLRRFLHLRDGSGIPAPCALDGLRNRVRRDGEPIDKGGGFGAKDVRATSAQAEKRGQ